MTDRKIHILAIILLIAAGWLAYANSLSAPFLFDDDTIVDSPALRHMPPTKELWLGTRPIVDLTLAINYAIGGTRVLGYHIVNITIHVLAGLVLFGILRRTLPRMAITPRLATFLAFAIALLWLVHPLNTEAVTYTIQRAESLMGLFFLLTLYCAIRGWDSARHGAKLWFALSIFCSLLGMGCKQVMVTAPVIVLLYERVFIANSVKEILRRRWPLYLPLALTMVVALRWAAPGMTDNTAGFAMKSLTPLQYALSQPGVILRYVQLSFWPANLVFDSRWPTAQTLAQILPPLLVIAALLVATLLLLRRKPGWGFWAAWFFLILAPTSSIMPITDLYFEHRMYLPLIGIIALVVLGVNEFAQWAIMRRRETGADNPVRAEVTPLLLIGLSLVAVCAVALGMATHARNKVYLSEVVLWQDTLAKRPDNARARLNLCNALIEAGQFDDARPQLDKALELTPQDAQLLYVAGNFHLRLAQTSRENPALKEAEEARAVSFYQRSLEIDPRHHQTHNNLGMLDVQKGKLAEAVDHLRQAVAAKPDRAIYHYNLGTALALMGQREEAIREFQETLRLDPGRAKARERLNYLLHNTRVPTMQ